MIDHRSNTCLTSSMVLAHAKAAGSGLLSICCHTKTCPDLSRHDFDYDDYDLKQDLNSDYSLT